jgi:hypothetical protein
MNDKEKKALELSVALWAALLDLEKEHPDDIHEHRRDIHSIQNRIAARPALREYNNE